MLYHGFLEVQGQCSVEIQSDGKNLERDLDYQIHLTVSTCEDLDISDAKYEELENGNWLCTADVKGQRILGDVNKENKKEALESFKREIDEVDIPDWLNITSVEVEEIRDESR